MRGKSIIFGLLGWVLIGMLVAAQGPVRTSQDVLRLRAQEALRWLHTQQEADGSFGLSWGQTADAVYVISLAGEDAGGRQWQRGGISALDALAAQTPSIIARGNGGEIGKLLRAVAASGRDVHNFAGYDVVQALLDTYDPTTGRFAKANNFGQAVAVQALALAGEVPPANAIASLLSEQRPNGGWGWPYRQEGVDVDTTGLVLETLAAVGIPATESHVQKGLAWLASVQREDGGWPSRPQETDVNCNSTALALRAVLSYGQNPRQAPWTGYNPDGSWRDAIGRLLQFQQADGGFQWRDTVAGTRVLSTTDALPVLLMPWPQVTVLDRHIFVPRVLSQ